MKRPLATGERSFTKWSFADFCSRHLVDYLQPDVCHCGGISELKKIGVLAETYRLNVAPHNPNGWVSIMASLHANATTPAATILESTPRNSAITTGPAGMREVPWFGELFDWIGPVIKNGYAELPTRPGLGVTLNEKVAAQHPYKPVGREEFKFDDGGVADQ